MTAHIRNVDGVLANMLTDERMRQLGFTDYREGYWSLWPAVAPDVTLHITINKSTGEWTEVVLDEMFGQPYHYGSIVDDARRSMITRNIDKHVDRLQKAGLDITVDHSLYGTVR